MNRLNKYLCVVGFLLFGCLFSAHAQKITSFSNDSVKFLKEIDNYLATGNKGKKVLKDYMESFSAAWNSDKCLHQYKKATYEICNLMLKKRIRPYPDFESFLSSVMYFVNSGLPPQRFSEWQKSLLPLVKGRSKGNLTEYLKMSKGLFKDGTFYDSPTTRWNSSSNKYTFKMDGKEPEIVFPDLNLRCYNFKNDSGIIYHTQGTFYPLSGKWTGKNGTVNWLRTGLDPKSVYAELNNYDITLKRGAFTADSVTFYNKNYFKKPLMGKMAERVISEPPNKATYPRFYSYSKRLKINNLTTGVNYDGGFSMRGRRFIGAGTSKEPAYLIFTQDDKEKLIAASTEYSITPDQIVSEQAQVTIRLDTDSIYHPGLELRYNIKKKHLILVRSDQGISQTPYSDTYHKVDMYFEVLSWDIQDSTMEFRMLPGNTQEKANFPSDDYYKQDRYDMFQQMDGSNLLVTVQHFVKYHGGQRDFYLEDLADYMNLEKQQAFRLVMQLTNAGFLTYDVQHEKIHVKDRLFNYIAARNKRRDYDVLNFHSDNPGQDNARMNLLSDDLTIYGVRSILLSDSQNVFIYPKDGKIVLHKNRNFSFSGIVNAGRFEFFGKLFSFDYDNFKINLTNVDSLRMRVEDMEKTDKYGRHPLIWVRNVIQDINGQLYIDKPNNKSGIRNYAQYPIFNSAKDAYVYYNKGNIQHGVYKKDRFYFHLKPFKIDSLDNMTNASLQFKGVFVSDNIFPQFNETLSLQPDYSLGFVHPTPASGMAMYKGKGVFHDKIKMSNKGLGGDGTLDYVTSVTKSDNFMFFPDSMNTTAQVYHIKQQAKTPQFPEVKGESIYVHWMPKKDYMLTQDKKQPFVCYNGQSKFSGTFKLDPKVLTGHGKMDFSNANLTSNLIKFKENEFNADTANFGLNALAQAGLGFSTNNVNAHVDFKKREGDFKSDGKGSVVKFPVNQYICFMDNFKWFMDQGNIELGSSKKNQVSSKDLSISGSRFISVRKDQDSLSFIAPSAKFSLKDYIIRANGVKFINVADARVYPDSGHVIIKKKAYMETLNNAKILANTTTEYYQLYDASVNIFSRKRYAGSGKYDYVDELKKKQTIFFHDISVDTTYQTYAETDIPDTSHFMLSPHFMFKGNVKLTASKQFLTFTGSCKILHRCDQMRISWVKFSSDIDPNQIFIPISSDIRDDGNKQLAASFMLSKDSAHIYPAFLSPVTGKHDVDVLPAQGYLVYNKAKSEYQISNKEKLVERNLPGSYLSLNTKRCIMYGEGKMDLGMDLGQVQMQSVGEGTDYIVPDSVTFSIMTSLNFMFDNGAMSKMADDINNATDLKPIDFSKKNYTKGLRELLGKNKADKLISQLNLYGSFKHFPDELKKTIFFSELNMKWDPASQSYLSVGPIGLGNINKTQINKYVDGHVQFKKRRGGDEINIYIEVDDNTWYYFNYFRGFMQAVSSNKDFNQAITNVKADKRTKKGEKGQGRYTYNLSSLTKKSLFLRHISPN